MAEKRTQELSGPIPAPRARELLLKKYRDRIAAAPKRSGGPWHGYVRDLEAGLPFTCERWRLPCVVRESLPPGDMYEWWRLDGNTLALVDSPVDHDEASDR